MRSYTRGVGGQQRDASRTRARILATARAHFAQHGFDRATVRAIATDAGVAPNLITRYFGGKQGLFDHAAESDLGVRDVFPGPRSELGARIAAHVVARWETSPGDDPLLMMLRAASGDPVIAVQTAAYFRQHAAGPLAEHLGGGDGPERAAAVGALIMGVVMQRYVLAAGPVAEAAADDVSRWLGEAVQRLVGGEPMPALTRRTGSDAEGRPRQQ